ncbi:AMP-binding protein [Sneathiella sp. CAU 1612]|uniref:AMP-binding protein n=1 Tax=Sneathiella sedimenti TaxID=2816034 RepID=A0ABS3F783_9PROT|nr:AMP-binding protein [Sneathiella sedimenti]MBO0334386.1 AMP-binding protein [Sneathiella sedimenti]
MTTVYEAFCTTVAKYPDNPFLCVPAYDKRSYHPDGVEITYAEAAGEVERLRSTYRGAGFSHGNRVAFLLENRPDYLLHLLAANSLGVSCVPINPDYLDDEMLYLLDHSDVDLVVTIEARATDVQKVALQRSRPLPVVIFEKFAGHIPRPRPAPYPAATIGLMSEVSLLYTSGTTGRPKGCILTNEYFLTAGQTYLDLGGVAQIREGQERLYNPLPLFHMNAGAVSFVCMILSGGCLVIPDRFHPTTWWQELIETKASIIHYLGIVPPLLLNQPKRATDTAHNVRFGVGAGVEPELHEVFEKRFGFPLVEVWGMTETGRIFADCIEPRQIHTRAFGRPTGDMLARVVDEKDQDVPAGTEGELLVKCAGNDPRRGFFAGYLKNDDATEEAWKGGWFHTGDTVRQDGSGMLYFVDRKKNIIRRSGENIAAAEVEAVLQTHDDIAKVAVIAVKDELREEEVMACIVLMDGVPDSEEKAEEIFTYANDRLAYFKTPGWILFLDDLPTTGTQKIQKTRIFGPDVDPRTEAGAFDFKDRKKKSR